MTSYLRFSVSVFWRVYDFGVVALPFSLSLLSVSADCVCWLYLYASFLNLFRIYALFQNKAFDGEITYPDTFNLRDYATDLQYYLQAKNSGVQSPSFIKEIDKEIARGVVEDSDRLDEILEEIDNTSGTGEFTQEEVNKEEE